MKIINTTDSNFNEEFENILARAKTDIKGVSSIVTNIIDEIVENGNSAIKEHILKFDKWEVKKDSDLEISIDDMKKAYENIDDKLRESLHTAYDRIKSYHEKQLPKSWIDFEKNGTILGQKVSAVDSAGLYIPGGKAAYPSSLLMNAIPAIVAGVVWLIKNWEDLKETAIWLWEDGIKPTFQAMGDFLLGIFTTVKEFIAGTVQGIHDTVVGIFTSIGTFIGNIWNGIKNGAVAVALGIKQAFTMQINGVISLFEAMANGVISALNFLIRGMNKIQVKIPNWVPKIGGRKFGVNIQEIARIDIPRLAEGGIVTQSTLANIGEAGPEAVIPLDKLKNFGVGGGGVTINISTMIGSREYADQMGKEIMRGMSLNSRSVGF